MALPFVRTTGFISRRSRNNSSLRQTGYSTTERPNSKKFLVFKTETTGLPKDINAPVETLDNWPRLVSLKWKVYSTEGELVSTKGSIIQPSNFTISKELEAIHGISNEHANMYGRPLDEMLDLFVDDLNSSTYLVAHNLVFDYQVARSELCRTKKKYRFRFLTPISLMEHSKNFVNIPLNQETSYVGPKPTETYKNPSLSELYYSLFNKKFDKKSADFVEITAHSFLELVHRRIIVPSEIARKREEQLQKLFL